MVGSNFAIRFDDFLKMLEALFEMWPFLMKDSEYTQWRAFHKNQFIPGNINQNIKRTRDWDWDSQCKVEQARKVEIFSNLAGQTEVSGPSLLLPSLT